MKTGYTGNVQAAYNQVQNIAKHKNPNTGNIQALNNQIKNIEKHGKVDKGILDEFLQAPVDTYTPSSTRLEGVADPAMIDKLWNDTNHVAEAVRKLVSSMLGRSDATGQSFWAIRAYGSFEYYKAENGTTEWGKVSFEFNFESTQGRYQLSEAERAQAQELIDEDGFFGVKQTTARIMDFAKALVGKDAGEDKIGLMRSAVQKGFDEVAALFGGFDNLPDVSKKTFDAIMKAFEEWQNGDAPEETEEAE